MATLGERIRTRREQLNLTQDQLAEMIGVKNATISRYETGSIPNPPQSKLIALMAALKVDASYLLDQEVPVTIDDVKEQLRRKPGMRTLFKAASNATEADLIKFSRMIEAMNGRDNGEGT